MSNFVKMVNAMSFIPTSSTLEEQKYITTTGRILFKAGVTGQITFECPFPTIQLYEIKKGGLRMELRYYRELRASDASVNVALRRYELFKGNVQTVLQMNSDNQNPQGTSGSDINFAKLEASHDVIIDTSKYGYYFQITLKRNKIEFSQPDDIGGGSPEEKKVAVLDLRIIGYNF